MRMSFGIPLTLVVITYALWIVHLAVQNIFNALTVVPV